VYVDDNFGRPFAEATRRAMLAEGTTVSTMIPVTASEDSVATAVASVVATQAEVVVVIADGATGPAIIAAIDDASSFAPTYVVNDAIRRPATSAQPFGRSLGARVEGVSPLAYPTSDSFMESLRGVNPTATGLFAHNAYDCLNAIALAAQAAQSDNPAAMARQVPIVTDQGTPCGSFTTCAEAIEAGRQINYTGPGRDLTIGNDGEVLTAVFERFTFDADGRDVGNGFVTVGD
jgi:branched-chain amino acid transport system substrate-binding protein